MKCEWNLTCIKRNARPNNIHLITYYLPMCYLLRIQQYPVNTTYNSLNQGPSDPEGDDIPMCHLAFFHP